jgi:5-methyltetrahydropteroyltriglutamate--homocysteine methyltransferase
MMRTPPHPLPTTVIGSYSLPRWLELVREVAARGELTPEQLEEAHDNAVKSAIVDQQTAGIDLITDGELRRETMVYFFTRRIAGYDNSGRLKPIGNLDPTLQMPDPVVVGKVAPATLADELVRHYRFLAEYATAATKVCITGPHMLAKRAHNDPDGPYRGQDRPLVEDLAGVLNEALRALVAAGCQTIQIDEPVWVGYPEELEWAIPAYNRMLEGVDAYISLHICYGNYQRRRLFTGDYRDLFPAVLHARADCFSFEFTPQLDLVLDLFRRYGVDRDITAGVIDVKNDRVETPEEVVARVRRVLEVIPLARLSLSPDCGLKFTPRALAYAKLKALGMGARLARQQLASVGVEAEGEKVS